MDREMQEPRAVTNAYSSLECPSLYKWEDEKKTASPGLGLHSLPEIMNLSETTVYNFYLLYKLTNGNMQPRNNPT